MAEQKLRDMTEPELSATMTLAANGAVAALPEGTLFILLAFDPAEGARGRGVAQYIANCERSSVAASLREAADRIEKGLVEERARFEGPTYTCPRCGSVSHSRDDVRLGYCGHCHRFHGTDEV